VDVRLLDLFSKPKTESEIEKVDKKNIDGMKCEKCFSHAPYLYDCSPWLYCIECAEADMRRKRFEEEEEFFK
jgi:hypothetical protein